MCDIGIILLFIGLWMLCGRIGIYGMADGFVFTNLTLFWGGIDGHSRNRHGYFDHGAGEFFCHGRDIGAKAGNYEEF